MTDDPRRLLEDPSRASVLRRDLSHAARTVAVFDTAAGLARFEATRSSGVPHARWRPWRRAQAALGVASVLGVLAAGALAVHWRHAPTDTASRTIAQAPTPPPAALSRRAVPPNFAPTAGARTNGLAPREPQSRAPSVRVGAPERSGAWASRLGPRGALRRDRGAHDLPRSAVASNAPTVVEARAARARIDPAQMAMLDPGRERRQLSAAYGLVDAEPARALELAEHSGREFPAGAREEWEALAVRALVRLGRAPEARVRARVFLARYPRGAFSAFVRQFAAGGGG